MKKLLFFVCAIFAFVACTQIVIEEQQGIAIEASETLTVGFEDGDQTRIQLNEAQKTVWNKEDLASVFYRSDANQKWQYQGETGERVGDLKRVENAVGTTKTTKTVVVYPYSENYWLNTDSYAIEATLPATQYYAEGSYGVGSNLMVSQSEFTQFSLKSVCGWIKLQLTGNGEVVKSIKFRGNNEEQVAGLIYVDTATAEATLASEMGGTDDNNAGGNLVFDDTIFTELTLDCGEGVTLGEEVTTFYLSLPPQTFANGFTVDIESKGYEILTLSTTNELVIERNMIQPMTTIEPEFVKQYKPTNNEIWYTNGSTTEATTPYKTDVFGANIISNTYSVESECWIITFDGDVTTIGDLAFYNCSSLTNIAIPNNVATIGDRAFYGCNSLIGFKGKFASTDGRCLIVDGTLLAFAPAGLTEYTIPNSVISIGNQAFYNCSNLTSITIPNSVISIGNQAFFKCCSLTSITIPESITSIGSSAFSGCTGELIINCNIPVGTSSMANEVSAFYDADFVSATIGDGVTSIGKYAFYCCSNLRSVTIPDSVTSIGNHAFNGCSSLTSITIPDSVTSIGGSTFYDCKSLTSITIPDSVTSIGSDAFRGCTSLTSITIPDSVTEIESYAFSGCTSLTSVTIPDSVTSIGNHAFYSCRSLTSVYISDIAAWCNISFSDASSNPLCNECNLYLNNELVIDLTIPDCVTTIGNHAFKGCSSLTSVNIPDSVTSIGDEAFYDCTGELIVNCNIPSRAFYFADFTSVTIGECVTSIGKSAFYNCSSLTSITIPDSVTSIGTQAFYGCKGELIIRSKSLVETDYESSNNPMNNQNGWLYNSGFTKLTIGDNITKIGSYAFYCCSNLTSVTIPDSVTSIGKAAFNTCESLVRATIGNGVTSIGAGVFYGCEYLQRVDCKATIPPTGGLNMFLYWDEYEYEYVKIGCNIYVPTASVDAYKSAEYWSDYKNYIVGYDF